MKKIILLSCFALWYALSFAQGSTPVEVSKSKQTAPIVLVRQSDQDDKKIQVYPNPSNGIVNLTLAGFKGKKTELRVMNVIGNVIYREVITDIGEQYTKTIDLTKYASGLYYVKLQADDFSEIRKVIIN